MNINDVQLPAASLAAKVGSEGVPVHMEFDSLPEKYKSRAGWVKQRCCMVAIAHKPEKTASGLYIPDSQKDKAEYAAQFGRIEAVGPFFYVGKDGKQRPEAPKVGDVIHFTPFSGRRIKIAKGQFITINDTDILAGPIDPEDEFEIYM